MNTQDQKRRRPRGTLGTTATIRGHDYSVYTLYTPLDQADPRYVYGYRHAIVTARELWVDGQYEEEAEGNVSAMTLIADAVMRRQGVRPTLVAMGHPDDEE